MDYQHIRVGANRLKQSALDHIQKHSDLGIDRLCNEVLNALCDLLQSLARDQDRTRPDILRIAEDSEFHLGQHWKRIKHT